jgi:hypothetical protein
VEQQTVSSSVPVQQQTVPVSVPVQQQSVPISVPMQSVPASAAAVAAGFAADDVARSVAEQRSFPFLAHRSAVPNISFCELRKPDQRYV